MTLKLEALKIKELEVLKIKYFRETDTLYIKLSEKPSVESEEVDEGIVFDYDENGLVVGIEIENFTKRFEIHK